MVYELEQQCTLLQIHDFWPTRLPFFWLIFTKTFRYHWPKTLTVTNETQNQQYIILKTIVSIVPEKKKKKNSVNFRNYCHFCQNTFSLVDFLVLVRYENIYFEVCITFKKILTICERKLSLKKYQVMILFRNLKNICTNFIFLHAIKQQILNLKSWFAHSQYPHKILKHQHNIYVLIYQVQRCTEEKMFFFSLMGHNS